MKKSFKLKLCTAILAFISPSVFAAGNTYLHNATDQPIVITYQACDNFGKSCSPDGKVAVNPDRSNLISFDNTKLRIKNVTSINGITHDFQSCVTSYYVGNVISISQVNDVPGFRCQVLSN